MSDKTFLEALNETADTMSVEPDAPVADAPAAEPESPAIEAASEDLVEPAASEQPAEPDAAAAPVLAPPEHWSKKDKDAFLAADDNTKSWLLDRFREQDREIGRKAREAADLRRQAEPILEAMKPHLSEFAARGMSPDQAIRQILAISQGLTDDPARYLARVVETYGRPVAGTAPARDLVRSIAKTLNVPVDALYDDDTAPVEQAQSFAATEIASRLEAKIAELERQLSGVTQTTQAQQHNAAWQSFAGAVDAGGQPLYPHANTLQRHILAILNDPGFAPDVAEGDDRALFKAAYEEAAWRDPSTRAALMQQSQGQQAAQRQQAELERRRAASRQPSAAPTPAGKPSDQPPAKFQDALLWELERLEQGPQRRAS